MDLFQAILLGIVQGLTEFLPVSSSAHLRITSELMGIGDAGAAFTAITQIGTELAVVVFFWRDIVRIIAQWCRSLAGRVPRRDPDALMGWWIILGSIPIVVLGLLFQHQIESVFRSLWLVATMLIVFGVLLGVADWVGKRTRSIEQLTWKHGMLYGFAQALALIPGVSRSGGTLTAGLLMGYTREAAARYSFLLAIPAVLGAGGFQLVKALRAPVAEGTPGMGLTLVATVIAFLVALVVIGLFMRYISTRSFMPFVVYRIGIGIVIMVLLGTGVLDVGGSVQIAEGTVAL